MMQSLNRRAFLQRVAGYGAATLGAAVAPRVAFADDKKALPPAKPHTLTVIDGKPRERGRLYGRTFKDSIQAFLDREIYQAFNKPFKPDDMLRYAGGCANEVRAYSPVIHDELEGMAEGSGIRLEELVLITLHEEFWHKGVLPKVEHCTAVAVGPPDTRDGNTYVAQTWDWMQSVFGLSSMLLWKRPEGPSLLAYAFPGLWCGAGLNSAGIALTWTSAGSVKGAKKIAGPRVGIPSYILLTQLLYQESLEAAVEEAKRAKQAGWFTFVLADGKGQLANIEGSPEELAVELHKGQLARVDYGSRKMTNTPAGEPVKCQARCQHTYDLLATNKGKLDRAVLQSLFEDPKRGICQKAGTIDMMIYNCTAREAWLSRGSEYGTTWTAFHFA